MNIYLQCLGWGPRHSLEDLTMYRVRAPITAASVIMYEGKPAIRARAGLTITILIDVSETMDLIIILKPNPVLYYIYTCPSL